MRAPGRVALQRSTHRGPRRTRTRAAHVVGAARGNDGRRSRRGQRDGTVVDLADADRQGGRRCRRAHRVGGSDVTGRLQLREICGYRAGDKGDIANVAIFADDDETYALIVREVTAARVKEHFGAVVRGRVDRYEAPNVRALNFVMQGALGGGGPRSLRADSLGKTLGGALVRMEIEVPDSMAGRRRPRPQLDWADEIVNPR